MNFLGIGYGEILIIIVAALIIFGPQKLPEVAGQAARWLRDARKMMTDLSGEFERNVGMKAFKDGAFRLAIEKQVPIVPITFLDNWRLLGDPEKWTSRGHPGIARAVVHPPVRTKGLVAADMDTLRRHVFDIIEAPLCKEYPGS